MLVIPKPGLQVIDRGDTEAVDFQNPGNFTLDRTWRDLDWSALVPAGSKYIDVMVNHSGPTATDYIRFRKKGYDYVINGAFIVNRVANLIEFEVVRIALDADGVCQYYGDETTLLALLLTWIRAYK